MVGIPYFLHIFNGLCFYAGDINIFLHRQCNGGFIDIRHVYVQLNRGAMANMYLN